MIIKCTEGIFFTRYIDGSGIIIRVSVSHIGCRLITIIRHRENNTVFDNLCMEFNIDLTIGIGNSIRRRARIIFLYNVIEISVFMCFDSFLCI